MKSPGKSHNYREDIDGLRGVAVALVIAYHLELGLFPGGFIGVDVFFVISGYLVTDILLRNQTLTFASMVDFYNNRIRRIVPALTVLMVFSWIAALALLSPYQQIALGKSIVATSLFVSNIYFFLGSGYFAAPKETELLLHTWSLGIEEQFYLLFPLIVALSARIRALRLGSLLIGMALASFMAAALTVNSHPNQAFYLLPFRAWELLAGAICAVYGLSTVRQKLGRLEKTRPAWIGLFAILASALLLNSATSFPGLAALPAVAGTTAIIVFGNRDRRFLAVLSFPPLVFIGLISYSLYLYHWVLIVFTKSVFPGELSPEMQVILAILSVACAALSWRFVERPFRYQFPRAAKPSLILFSAATTTTIALGLFSAALTDKSLRDFEQAKNENRDSFFGLAKTLEKCQPEKLGIDGIERYCRIGDPEAALSFLVWGDSHAAMWSAVFERVAASKGEAGVVISMTGCPPLVGARRTDGKGNSGKCLDLANKAADYIASFKPGKTFLISRWSLYSQGKRNNGRLLEAHHLLSEEDSISANEEQSQAVLVRRLKATISQLKPYTQSTVFLEVPALPADPRRLIESPQERSGQDFFGPKKIISQLTEPSLLLPSELPDTAFFNPANLLCTNGLCRFRNGTRYFYMDDNHITLEGGKLYDQDISGLLN
jgi:peptidoglycan/LPS O-acetylase OafA/YrhL